VAGEMSGESPVEFLKSQCVVARSWVLAHTEKKHTELPVDRCNDDCCQRYHGTTDLTDTVLGAVRDTRGLVLLDAEGRLIDANYSKSCGGISESPENVWSVSKSGQRAAVDAPAGSEAFRFFPVGQEHLDEYLTGAWLENTDVFCSPNVVPEKELPRYLSKVDEGGGHFRWRVSYRRAELEDILRHKFFHHQDPTAVAPLETLLDLRVLRRGLSGRASELEIVYLDPMGARRQVTVSSEYSIRDALHEQFLYSSAFNVQREDGSDGLAERFIFRGAGWGHGAGLCQIGALGMALRGYDCSAILTHYFEGISLQACY
jgi:stage II sporulation protein D